MNESLHNFIESLREELKQYGELLALLDSQQEKVIHRLADELVMTVSAIDNQGEAIHAARRERRQRQRELAQSLGMDPETTISDLLALLPASYQPLVRALVEENNQLLFRVRQRASQNHILMNRALELMGNFINSFCPAAPPTYTHAGAMAAGGVSGQALYEEVC